MSESVDQIAEIAEAIAALSDGSSVVSASTLAAAVVAVVGERRERSESAPDGFSNKGVRCQVCWAPLRGAFPNWMDPDGSFACLSPSGAHVPVPLEL